MIHVIHRRRIMLAKLSSSPNRLRIVPRCYASTYARLDRVEGGDCVVQKKLLLTGKFGSGLTAAVGVSMLA